MFVFSALINYLREMPYDLSIFCGVFFLHFWWIYDPDCVCLGLKLSVRWKNCYFYYFPEINNRLLSENEISYLIRGASFKIVKSLGPGLLETVYESALAYELIKKGCEVKKQVPVPVFYGDTILEIGFRLDLLINDLVIIEVKSVDCLSDIHYKQLLTYLKLTNLKLGLLINFNTMDIENSIFRIVNKL